MLPFLNQVSLIRYLIVWRVSGSLVQLPRSLSPEISRTLATIIAERLPTQQARPWRKTVEAWASAPGDAEAPADGTADKASHGAAHTPSLRPLGAAAPGWPTWPIESVVWAHPAKRSFGQGEPILWELKLLGNDADHGVFLETILPAMEAAATTSDERWYRQRTLWGRFDIQAVYVSRGSHWEPIVTDGRLDLSYRVTPSQWVEGLALKAPLKPGRRKLTWLTPFDLDGQAATGAPASDGEDGSSDRPDAASPTAAPSLRGIAEALMARLAPLAFGKRATAAQAWAQLTPEEQASVWLDCDEGRLTKTDLERADKSAPGRWIGAQTFAKIPPRLLSYLELAATLHIGKHTHFGCGTFTLV